MERLGALPAETFEFYRDATFTESKFDLTLLDCWRGLARAKTLGWIDSPQNDGNVPFGSLDKDEYKHYDNPLNGDLHFVVPGKFIAFRGPVDLPGGEEYLDQDGFREFSAHYYVELFQVLGVSTVVRLNERRYDGGVFEAAGIRHVDLPFEDCTAPPDAVVARFLRAADAADGLIAVHCKAGLGRTGTLIALYLMRRNGFTARAAMGWLRIMRPGSVIGEQQHYLCAAEQALRTPPLRPLRLSGPRGSGSARRAVEAVAAATAAALSTADEECSAPSSPGDRPRRLPTLQLSPAPSHADAPAGCTSVTACSAGDRDPLPKEKVSGAGVASSLRLGQASILRSLTINGGAPRRLGVLSAAAAAAAAADGDDSRGPRSLAQALAAQVSAGLECRSAARARRGSVQ